MLQNRKKSPTNLDKNNYILAYLGWASRQELIGRRNNLKKKGKKNEDNQDTSN